MRNIIKAGVVQFDVKKGEMEHNLNTALGYLEELAAKGVCLAVLPEMFSCSFDNENLNDHARFTNKIIERLSFFAKEHQIAVVGTIPEREEDRIYNTMMFFDVDGKVKGKYRKIHLFRLTGEHLYYAKGNEIITIDTSFGRIGLLTCYDLRFPELARELFFKGAKMIVVSAQWPEKRKEHWEILARARAIENQLFMVCSNRTGLEDQLQFPGMSMVVDPMGNILAHAGSDEASAFAEIDMNLVEEFRTIIPCSTDRRPEIYG